MRKVNDKHTSKRLRKLYCKRKGRLRHAVNTLVYRFIEACWLKEVSEIIMGDLNGIRETTTRGRRRIQRFTTFRVIDTWWRG